MTIAVLTPSTTETTTKRREPLRTIDMATTQAQARPAPSAGSGSRGRGRGKMNSTRLSVNEQEENGNGNMKGSEKKRKTGELVYLFWGKIVVEGNSNLLFCSSVR